MYVTDMEVTLHVPSRGIRQNINGVRQHNLTLVVSEAVEHLMSNGDIIAI